MPTPGVATRENQTRSAAEQVDQRMPNFVNGMQAVVPGDGEWYQLTDPALGVFNVGVPPPAAGQLWPDKAVRSVKLTNWGDGTQSTGFVEVSGLWAVDDTLPNYPVPGDRLAWGSPVIIGVSTLGAIALRNATEAPIQVDILFVAEDQ